MERNNFSKYGWLDAATRDIRFGPDRMAVRAELAAHLEDKQADLCRIFPDIPPEEAEQRALEAMGDPEEIGRELAKIYKPWLGYLWRVSKWVAVSVVLIFLAINILKNDYYQSAGHPLWGQFSTVYGQTTGEKIRMGGYTFQIVGAAFVDYPEDSPYIDGIQVAFQVSTPRFWERMNRGALNNLTITVGDGYAWKMSAGKVNFIEENMENQMLCGVERAEWGVFHDTYIAWADAQWQAGDPVCLRFDFDKGSFTLTTDKLERVVKE